MMKIGIIECDKVAPDLAKDYGEYADMIMATLSPHASFEFTLFNAVNCELPDKNDDCGGYIITGSTHDAYSDQQWIHSLVDWIRLCDEQKKPLIGICFGHQIISLALGGTVRKSEKGWGIGMSVNEVHESPQWMTPHLDVLNLLVSHQDQVIDIPDSMKIIASSEFCPNYMLSKDDHILTVQGHPEFSVEFDRKLVERKKPLLTMDQYDHALTSLELPPHSSIVMQWFAQFLSQK
ncbi:glutamine amidotransferase-related protein [Vibrio salinus]|uniref:glutamine amidotransferase-related protein n=1 Tax=Vibrio salinus TaxID=2899784 RepID=UPI001E30CD70|nr:gamma-glutamyl-gamma-aminobutyrate hydrolase family protein [Vibrio salinus]MCE0494588.1 gamma-glutamyl-gamma-aminobutyrate hydrolase family protein [Vibrio salinus]